MRFSAERSRMGHDCVLLAQVGCSGSSQYNSIMSEMLDYHSVIRVLLRHGCELKSILNLLLNNFFFSIPAGFSEMAKSSILRKRPVLRQR